MQTALPASNRSRPAGARAPWRAVAIPTEHGGWGLTAEPIVLGLFLAFSWSGVAIGAVAGLAFLLRTPLKLAVVDRRRGRTLDRTVLARRLAIGELTLIAVLAAVAIGVGGTVWLLPIALATPFVAIELWFDVRSRGRRLVPEVCGSIGISAMAASIVLAGGGSSTVAAGAWMVLSARAISAIPFVRTQIARLRHGSASLRTTDLMQCLAISIATLAVVVEPSMLAGATAIVALAAIETVWVRRSFVPPAKALGLAQVAVGVAVVAATTIGVLAS